MSRQKTITYMFGAVVVLAFAIGAFALFLQPRNGRNNAAGKHPIIASNSGSSKSSHKPAVSRHVETIPPNPHDKLSTPPPTSKAGHVDSAALTSFRWRPNKGTSGLKRPMGFGSNLSARKSVNEELETNSFTLASLPDAAKLPAQR